MMLGLHLGESPNDAMLMDPVLAEMVQYVNGLGI